MISDVGMAGAFGIVLDEPEDYILLILEEFALSRIDAGSGLQFQLFFPGIRCDDEPAVFVDMGSGSGVEWNDTDILSVGMG